MVNVFIIISEVLSTSVRQYSFNTHQMKINSQVGTERIVDKLPFDNLQDISSNDNHFFPLSEMAFYGIPFIIQKVFFLPVNK